MEVEILPIELPLIFMGKVIKLANELPRIFPWLKFAVVKDEPISIDINFAYNHQRRQYNAEKILNKLKGRKSFRVLGVTAVDLYVPELNFVFGVAEYNGTAALISLNRLRPEFYGEPTNEKKFFERIIKEAVHELGHTFSLEHCPESSCVTHFSNSVLETDIKREDFCRTCKRKLIEEMKKYLI
ncbi:MAG: archaemetzincin family Zn-dependent metalloprotease [Candidatus Jordarchaeales archaeon]